MAVRPQHMHDGGIVERRLRPIYDWLDNGYNKKALQEAEKVLKKSPSLQAARALKALALLRLGRNAEAHAVLDALADEKPSDDTTLQAMTISYRESQQLHKVCALYEAAVKAEPNSEELHSHLFMSYVRIGDHRAQQRAAMALYKFAPKNPYYFWAVMSIILQAKSADDPTKKNILLSLAQRMVDNFIAENKMEVEQEARLYIMILELQEKWHDILQFLESHLYLKLVPGSMPQAALPYLKKIGDWKKLNLICKDLLLENLDRWDYYMTYFDSVFELIKKGSEEDSHADDTAEKCHEFICLLVETMNSGKVLRGPYLARLELYRRLSETGDPSALLGNGVALCIQYLRAFAHKACAVPDLRPYLAMLPQQEREERSREFLTCLGFDENSSPESHNDIQRHVNCLGVWRLCAPPGDAATNEVLATTFRQHYLTCLRRGLLSTTSTEFGPADMYALLAAHHYFYLAMEQKSSKPLIESLCLLELVIEKSPSNFHVKLLLVRIYHLLGCGLAADAWWARLDAKHVQLATLCWAHGARLPALAAPKRALQLLADLRAFHTHHAKDSVEHLTYAYKYGTFEKLVELIAWTARMAACRGAALAARERALLALVAGPPQPLHAPPPPPEEPTDNRDLDVIVSWEPPQFIDKDLKSRTMEYEVAYLRLKDGIVSAIALCIELSDGRSIEEKTKHFEELNTCVDAFGEAMEKCRQKYVNNERITLSTPLPSRLFAFVNAPVPYRELYTCTLRMVGELALQRPCVRASAESAARLLDSVAPALREATSPPPAPADCAFHVREALEHLGNYLEFIGVITYLLGICNELTTPANAKKSKKKANQSPEEVKVQEQLVQLNVSVQNSIVVLQNIFETWPQYDALSSLEKAMENLNFEGSYQCAVESRLKKGFSSMVEDVINILKKKTTYLKSLIPQSQ